MTEHEAYILLNMAAGNLSGVRFYALLQNFGSLRAVFEASEKDLVQVPGISSALAAKIVNGQKTFDLEQELRLAERAGVSVITLEDDTYPELLREINNPPLCLYVRGTLPRNLAERSIAMVGTRNISQYGAKMARHLAESAAYCKWTTVSGIAVGVDTVVHQATVDAGGATIAVLGGGIAHFHPQENLKLAREILQTGGAVISEYPMHFIPTRYSFPQRNRIISGLTMGTVVIEAGLNSGSLITAACALEQNRHVFAVPGQADHENANGCNELIRKGATLVERFEHILEAFEFLPGFSAATVCREEKEETNSDNQSTSDDSPFASPEDQQQEADLLQLSDTDLRILNALKSGPKSIDAISNATGLSASEIMSAVIALELLSRIHKRKDGAFERVR